MQPIGIVGLGSYLPQTVIGNEEIAAAAGVSDEWIVRKTGIRERRRAAAHEATSDLAAAAARKALQNAGLSARQLSYVVVATSTPDQPQPATASIVQHLIGAHGAAAFDLNSVCSGFVHALKVVQSLLAPVPGGREHVAGAGAAAGTGTEIGARVAEGGEAAFGSGQSGAAAGGPYGLVIGADLYSRILDYTDRRTAVLFGDGASAVVLGPVDADRGLLDTLLVSHGDRHDLIGVPAGGSRLPASAATVAEGAHYFRMDGREVRAFVQERLPGAVHTLLDRAGVSAPLVEHVVPHQANGVMLAELWPALRLRNAELHLTVDRHANTGAASVGITLDSLHREGRLYPGDLVLLLGFGGGMSVGASLLRWSLPAMPRVREVGSAGAGRGVPAGVGAGGPARDGADAA